MWTSKGINLEPASAIRFQRRQQRLGGSTWPASGARMFMIMRMIVLLPAPLGPSSRQPTDGQRPGMHTGADECSGGITPNLVIVSEKE